MAISKSSVSEFVSDMCGTRRAAVQKEIDAFYAEHVDPTFNNVIKDLVGDVPLYAERMLAVLEAGQEKIKALGGMSEYNLNDFIRNLNNRGLNLFSSMRSNARGNIIYTIENPHNGAFDYGNDELNKLVQKLQRDEHLKDMLKRRRNIDTLRKELGEAVDACKSGKQAYDTMVRLGVDMSDYKEPQKNLPAVVNLSADVCLLNGTC